MGHIPRGKGSSERSTLSSSVSSSNSSSLPGASAGPLATSALTPAISPFSAPPLAIASQGARDGRRGVTEQPVSSSSTSSATSQLFPLFPSSVQETGRGAGKGERRERSLPPSQESAPKEKDLDRSREREKENKREGKRDWGEKKGGKVPTPDASPNVASSLFIVDGRETDNGASLVPKKAPGRKKSTLSDVVPEPAPIERPTLHSAAPQSFVKGRLHKKGRPSDKEAEPVEEEKEMEKPSAVSQPSAGLPGQPGRQQLPAPSLGSMLAQAEKQPVTDKQVVGLLKKAKAQLFKIEKSKSLKAPDQPKIQVC